jgi:hypothetical protein
MRKTLTQMPNNQLVVFSIAQKEIIGVNTLLFLALSRKGGQNL